MSDEPKKRYNAIDYEDLDQYDINMIRDRAHKNFLESNTPNGGAQAVIEAVFVFLYLKGMRIVKDETRQDTWSTPTKGWYAEYKAKKTDW